MRTGGSSNPRDAVGYANVLVLLKVLSVVIVGIGVLKVVLGAHADRLLDPGIPESAANHPSIDSQVRFYGGAFSVYGVLLWMCSTDMTRYTDVFVVLMVVFFLAGCARIPSLILRGRPSLVIMGLFALEIVVPPILLWWHLAL
jgi:Domain of unknown function (DUF4345)